MKDLIIIGSGIAGLTASIYASRYKIDHLVIGEVPGGQGTKAGIVENYPGYGSIGGVELMQKVLEQAKSYGVEILQEQIDKLAKIEGPPGGGFEVYVESKRYQAKALILALGASYCNLGVPGEKELVGKGVSYCTTCDGPLFRGKTVAVVGGGNSALSGAIHAAAFASKVYLIHRRDEFRAEPTRVEKMKQTLNIEFISSTCVKQVLGTDKVAGVVLDKPFQGSTTLNVDGVFIEIGQVPSSSLAKQLGVDLDEKNYVKVNPCMHTNIEGVCAAGDIAVVSGGFPLRQLVTASADGARAAVAVYEYLHKGGTPNPSWGSRS
ncbi:MAG: FAD-dependent oxidoreductase [bacterium]|nr:FAD-dependent oxidoreductase [bacterium]